MFTENTFPDRFHIDYLFFRIKFARDYYGWNLRCESSTAIFKTICLFLQIISRNEWVVLIWKLLHQNVQRKHSDSKHCLICWDLLGYHRTLSWLAHSYFFSINFKTTNSAKFLLIITTLADSGKCNRHQTFMVELWWSLYTRLFSWLPQSNLTVGNDPVDFTLFALQHIVNISLSSHCEW